MTSQSAGRPAGSQSDKHREVRMGELECPRCHESFTVSYYIDNELVQARCLSCELKWPLPNVV
jgi:hypothetical protein